jgi:hypothetical protein
MRSNYFLFSILITKDLLQCLICYCRRIVQGRLPLYPMILPYTVGINISSRFVTEDVLGMHYVVMHGETSPTHHALCITICCQPFIDVLPQNNHQIYCCSVIHSDHLSQSLSSQVPDINTIIM